MIVGLLPRVGLCSAGDYQPLAIGDIEHVRLLHLSHLRADVQFQRSDWQERLRRAMDEGQQLGITLELALHFTADAKSNLIALRHVLDARQPKIATWLLLQVGQPTLPAVVEIAHHYLDDYDPSASFAVGTDASFVELNRNRPPPKDLDLLSFSINPQVHAFDNASLVENLAAQAITLASARRFSAGRA